MPPRKKAAQAVSRPPLPPPNSSHPCAGLLPGVLGVADSADRPHPASYHCFLTSPFYPETTRTDAEPPKKRSRAAATGPKLPPVVEGALDAIVVQRKLLNWFDTVKENRGMPWRKEVDPQTLSRKEKNQRGYEVWVSEIMLQQTTVAAVIPYWTSWMEKFPNVEALAKADPEDVNAAWKGLGYYSRAKRLLDGAKTVVEKHGGKLPRTAEGLLDIDGIGPYSAGSISSIAFAARSALVDGNVMRVCSRLTALHAPPAAKSTTSFVWALADVLVPPQPTDDEPSPLGDVGGLNKPGAWNQALMELGATVCTPKNPKCDECPLNDECLAYAEARFIAHRPRSKANAAETSSPLEDIEDLCALCSPLPYETPDDARSHGVEVYPMAKEKTKKREEDTAVCVLEWVSSLSAGAAAEDERRVLLVKRPEKGLLAGLFEFPAIDLPPSDEPVKASTRSKQLDKLLRGLIDLSDFPTLATSDATSSAPSDARIVVRNGLPAVVQVYSHITRTYLAERVVLMSPTLPSLHAAPKRPTESSLVQSRVGHAVWVPAGEVADANVGGAVGKIWDERNAQAKGGRLGGGAQKNGKAAAGANGKKAKEGGGKAEKGQASLMGFFTKKVGDSEAKPRAKDAQPTKEDADGDDLVIIDPVKAAAERLDAPRSSSSAKAQPKPYKKRRIASDSEDE